MLSRFWKVSKSPSICMIATCGTMLAGGMVVYARHASSMRCLAEKFIAEHANQFNCTASGKPCHWSIVPHHGEFGQLNCTNLQNQSYLLGNASAYAGHVLSAKEFNLYLWAATIGVFIGVCLVVCMRVFCVNKTSDESSEYEDIIGNDDADASCSDNLLPVLRRRLSFSQPRFFSAAEANEAPEGSPTLILSAPTPAH